MKEQKWYRFTPKQENRLLAALLVLLLLLAVGLCFDYYYDLNDDVLMKDILSGRYTGVPDGHNIQMHFPLSFALSLLYRLAPSPPWYGLFLCLCQYGCLYLIADRSLRFCSRLSSKVLLLLLEGGLFLLLFLRHLVFVQYTVTSALCAVTAAVWFATAQAGRERLSLSAFLWANVPAVLLCLLSFCMRSEMFLLMLPFVGITGVFVWSMEKKVFLRENVLRYAGVFGLILAGLGLCQLLHAAGYSSGEWRDFNAFFDARTEAYDFEELPPYEENVSFYESVGLEAAQQQLLVNYNFGLEEKIDTALMEQVSGYAKEQSQQDKKAQLSKSLWNYRYRLLHNTAEPALQGLQDMPYNMVVFCFYVLVLFAALSEKKYRVLWQLLLLFAGRSAIWFFILFRDRDPVRITHPLYLMELAVLAVLLGWYLGGKTPWPVRRIKGMAAALALCVCINVFFLLQSGGGGGFWREAAVTAEEAGRREQVNTVYQSMLEECRKHPEQFYFADVYSTVDFSEKMFAGADNTPVNYDLLGGWCSKSPLQREKLAYFGLPAIREALLLPQVRLYQETGSDTGWLTRYYESRGIAVSVTREKTLCDAMDVYRVTAE